MKCVLKLERARVLCCGRFSAAVVNDVLAPSVCRTLGSVCHSSRCLRPLLCPPELCTAAAGPSRGHAAVRPPPARVPVNVSPWYLCFLFLLCLHLLSVIAEGLSGSLAASRWSAQCVRLELGCDGGLYGRGWSWLPRTTQWAAPEECSHSLVRKGSYF